MSEALQPMYKYSIKIRRIVNCQNLRLDINTDTATVVRETRL